MNLIEATKGGNMENEIKEENVEAKMEYGDLLFKTGKEMLEKNLLTWEEILDLIEELKIELYKASKR